MAELFRETRGGYRFLENDNGHDNDGLEGRIMSARYFCDVCEGEIIVSADDLRGLHSVNVRGREVHFTLGEIVPTGGEDICKSCALDALYALDDRPGVSK